MALKVQLVFLKPGDIKLLTAGAALQLTDNIFLIVAHDPAVVSVEGGLFSIGEGKNLRIWDGGFAHLVII